MIVPGISPWKLAFPVSPSWAIEITLSFSISWSLVHVMAGNILCILHEPSDIQPVFRPLTCSRRVAQACNSQHVFPQSPLDIAKTALLIGESHTTFRLSKPPLPLSLGALRGNILLPSKVYLCGNGLTGIFPRNPAGNLQRVVVETFRG